MVDLVHTFGFWVLGFFGFRVFGFSGLDFFSVQVHRVSQRSIGRRRVSQGFN